VSKVGQRERERAWERSASICNLIAAVSHLHRPDQPSTLTDAGTLAYYATLGHGFDRDQSRDHLLITARSSITLSSDKASPSNSLRQTVHTHCASVQAEKLVPALLRVARVTAGLAESNGSLQSGL